MLTQELAPEIVQEIDRETKRYLTEILAQEKTTAGELIRDLIHDRWIALNSSPCEPQFIAVAAVATATAPRRKNSKQVISDFMRRKCHSPNLCI